MFLESIPFLTLSGTLYVLVVSLFFNVWLLIRKPPTTEQPSRKKSNSALNLPKGWWSDPDRFQAERRAIFSQVLVSVSTCLPILA